MILLPSMSKLLSLNRNTLSLVRCAVLSILNAANSLSFSAPKTSIKKPFNRYSLNRENSNNNNNNGDNNIFSN